jgi:predicted ATPase/DNA-binding SARP family transcriptional activator
MGIRIGILGPLEVRDPGGRLLPVTGTRLRSLLIRLAISDGRPVPVDALAADLWPEGGPADAGNALQALVSRLRAAVGKDMVAYGPTGYRLAVPSAQIDAWAFERLVHEARTVVGTSSASTGSADNSAADNSAAGILRRALKLWRGPALADVADAQFAAPVIARLSELRLAAIEDRIEADLAAGDGAGLVPEVEQLATEHPLRERLRGQLMRALYAAGRQADALAVFEDTRRRLASDLGIDPSPALAEIHLAILRGELPARHQAAAPPLPAWSADSTQPAEAGTAPAGTAPAGTAPAGTAPTGTAPTGKARTGTGPTRARPPRSGNLPAQLTSFVGRDEELDRVVALLAGSRLITLTGPGGAGKTRLSVEAGARLAEQAPDGVWFVSLSPVREAAEVPQAVLTAVDGRETTWLVDPVEASRLAATDPLDRLSEALAGRSLILLLDNCEHVLDAVASLAGRVLADAPDVRILATSREPLGLTGEMLCPLPSLGLPPVGANVEQASASAAVRLFADRASAVRPGFAVDADTVGPVVRICRALDGIPLAIELAAARVRALTPAQVADRLDDRFALLSVGSRGALPRHQTLRAIVDWSWDLLDDTEREMLRRLSVFSDGATPESAEQVCSLGGDQAGIVEVIAALVDKSLVVASGQRHVRYRLLETVRAYAAERLTEAGEAGPLADAHADYFLALVERAEPKIRGPEQLTWLDLLTAEHDNCSSAIRHALRAGQATTVLRFVRALALFWAIRDYDSEASEWAAETLKLVGDTPPEGHAGAYAMCRIISVISRFGAGTDNDAAELRRLASQLTPPPGTTDPLLALMRPLLSVFTGEEERARRELAALSDHPDPWVRAIQHTVAGHVAISDGDLDHAAAELAASDVLFREIGDQFGLIGCLTGQAQLAVAQDRPEVAVRVLEQVQKFADDGLTGNLGIVMRIRLGWARALAGDVAGARRDLEEGTRLAEKIGELDDAALGYVHLGEIGRRAGDLTAARDTLEQALDLVTANEQRPDMAEAAALTFSRLGCLAEQNGDLAAAAQWQERAIVRLSTGLAAIMPSNPTLATVVEGIAALAAAREQPVRAAELLGLAHRLQGFRNSASLEVARAQTAIDAALSTADAEAADARGRGWGRAEALALRP